MLLHKFYLFVSPSLLVDLPLFTVFTDDALSLCPFDGIDRFGCFGKPCTWVVSYKRLVCTAVFCLVFILQCSSSSNTPNILLNRTINHTKFTQSAKRAERSEIEKEKKKSRAQRTSLQNQIEFFSYTHTCTCVSMWISAFALFIQLDFFYFAVLLLSTMDITKGLE